MEEDDHYEIGAKIVQEIIDENPQHPGALHYLIHSYDDPDHATLALDAANRYSKVAPDAEHALHMPSHIFVALGMWDEVIKSNIASYDASVARMKEKSLDNDARGYQSNAETKMVFGTPKMCSGVSRNLQPPSVNEVNSVKVLECELKSFMAMLNNNEKLAEKWMKEAIKLEGDTKYIYGPPNIVKPSFELYGEWLLSKGREEEAKEQFDIVMERSPKRRLSVKGLEKLNS